MTELPSRRFTPHRYRPGGIGNWSGHLPFAYDLVAALRPSSIVELGTHYGESYFGFCQSVRDNDVPAVCYAIDTWKGEEQSGFYGENVLQEVERYNRANYAAFSNLIQSTFDEASAHFGDGTIGLLHIDGLHTYEAVAHDFNRWLPKVKPGGIVLLHDIIVRSPGFEVWRLWEELARQFPSFAFHHSLGLGVLRVGDWPATNGEKLLDLLFSSNSTDHVRRHYVMLADIIEFRSRKAEQQLRSKDVVCTKIYPRGPSGYEEPTSESAIVETGKWNRISIELRAGSEAGAIRIDPCDTTAVIDIAEIQVRAPGNGTALWRCDQSSGFDEIELAHDVAILSRSDVLRCFSFGSDPQLILPDLRCDKEPLCVDMWFRIDKQLSAIIPALFGGVQAQLQAENEVRINERLRAELRGLDREQSALTSEIRSLAASHNSLQQELIAKRSELEAADQRVMEYNVRFSAALGEISALRGQVAEKEQIANEHQQRVLEHQQRVLEHQQSLLEHQHRLLEMEEQLAAVRENAAMLQQQVRDLVTSWSWQLTAPVRSLAGILGIRTSTDT